MPATWLTDTVRQLLTAYTQHTNFRLYFKQMLLVIDEHSDVDGRHVFDQDNKGWKAVSNALKGLVIDDDDQYHLSVHMMSSRSAENVCHISLVLPESEGRFFPVSSKRNRIPAFGAIRYPMLRDFILPCLRLGQTRWLKPLVIPRFFAI